MDRSDPIAPSGLEAADPVRCRCVTHSRAPSSVTARTEDWKSGQVHDAIPRSGAVDSQRFWVPQRFVKWTDLTPLPPSVANGIVTDITVTNPGSGYVSVPRVKIASPPFAPRLAVDVSRVRVTLQVVLGRKYQLEASTNLTSWSAAGDPFIAQDEEISQEFEVNATGRYFRINQVP